MVPVDGSPTSPDMERHIDRTSTEILAAAEAAESSEMDGNLSVVESRTDGKQIKFKKAKKIRKAASKHYLKHLQETKASRFKVNSLHSLYYVFSLLKS